MAGTIALLVVVTGLYFTLWNWIMKILIGGFENDI